MDSITKASADVGNSSTKVIVIDGVGSRARKQPTVINYLPTVPNFEDEDMNTLISKLHNNIVVHVTSPAIAQGGLFSVGALANVSGGSGFNIKHHKKSERDITIIQPLSMVAVTAIQNVYQQSNELPKTISINLEYATAIPIVDFSVSDAKSLEARLTGTHIFTVYIAESIQVQVTINVVDAKVVKEGIPALYAIVESKPSIFEAYNQRYGTSFTGKDFTKRKLLFVDIGDGTLELISVVNGNPIVAKSDGMRLGVGHASEKAMVAFKKNYRINADLTRSTFMAKVLNKDDKWHIEASNELKKSGIEQEGKIFEAIVDMIEGTLSSDVDDVVVFGGGTNVFKDLEQRLVYYTSLYKMRVLWIDGKDASLLNALGLNVLNSKVFFKK